MLIFAFKYMCMCVCVCVCLKCKPTYNPTSGFDCLQDTKFQYTFKIYKPGLILSNEISFNREKLYTSKVLYDTNSVIPDLWIYENFNAVIRF